MKSPPPSKKMSQAHFNPLSYLRSSTAMVPDYFVIQIDQLPQKNPAEPLPCAVCIVHDAHQDRPSAVSRATPGTIRCETHTMRCATCRGYVQEDSHICCHNCWVLDRLKRLVEAGTVEALLIEGRICRYHNPPLSQTQQQACNCLRCKKMLMAAVEARAVEEGQADRLSPPTSRESPHMAVSFALG
jgi:hypothetical protein